MSTKDTDSVMKMLEVDTHDFVLIFTNTGKVYSMPVYEIPEGSKISKGQPIVNFLQLESNEKAVEIYPKSQLDKYVFFVTQRGIVKKVESSNFENIRSNGLRALKFKDDSDKLSKIMTTDGAADIMITTLNGQSIRFNEEDVRAMGRTAAGVRGIRLKKNDEVVSATKISKEEKGTLLTLTENGIGKRTNLEEFKTQNRGGIGIRVAKISKKTGDLVVVQVLPENLYGEELIIVSELGIVIRVKASNFPILSRSAQGVIIMRMKGSKDKVVSCELVENDS